MNDTEEIKRNKVLKRLDDAIKKIKDDELRISVISALGQYMCLNYRGRR